MYFFLLGFIICVATKKLALYFKQHSVRASLATKVILFPINRAAYSQQINHFNGWKCFTIADDIQCLQLWTQRKTRFLQGFQEREAFCAGSLGLPFHKEPVQKYEEASAIFKYSPSLSVLFRYNCLLMFQLLSLFLSLFHGREISEARNFGARSILNLATNSEVNFLRSEEPPVMHFLFDFTVWVDLYVVKHAFCVF